MSSVINPVGPEEPGVYWRRRLLVGLGILVVLIIFFMLLRSCSSDPTPTAAPSPSPTPTATASSSPSASPSTSASGTAPDCIDSDIEVTANPSKGTSFAPGSPITFVMSIYNISDKPCKRNVGTKPNTVYVESGGKQVWSSDDCQPSTTDQIVVMQPGRGDPYQLNANWNQQLTSPGSCPTTGASAPPGSYEVFGKNDQVASKGSTFTIS